MPCSINRKQHGFFGVFGINTGSWYFKTSQNHSPPRRLVIFWWILKYHSWYLSQILLETVLFPILIFPAGLWLPRYDFYIPSIYNLCMFEKGATGSNLTKRGNLEENLPTRWRFHWKPVKNMDATGSVTGNVKDQPLMTNLDTFATSLIGAGHY